MLSRARHEVGHNLVARLLGFQAGDLSAEISGLSGGASAIDTSRPLRSIADIEKFCEERVMVLYAGVQAETLVNGSVDNDAAVRLAHDTGKNDHMMVQQLCNILRNIRYPDLPIDQAEKRMQDDENQLWARTTVLVEQHATIISDLAQEVCDRRAIHGKPAIFTEAELNAHPLVQQALNLIPFDEAKQT